MTILLGLVVACLYLYYFRITIELIVDKILGSKLLYKRIVIGIFLITIILLAVAIGIGLVNLLKVGIKYIDKGLS
ncbi:hypothetical protein [Enterococcus sp. LJL90]